MESSNPSTPIVVLKKILTKVSYKHVKNDVFIL